MVTPEIVEQLEQFTDTVYLSQTIERHGDGSIRRFLNLRDALTCWEPGGSPMEWRTHFHVPVFLEDLGGFGTTRFAISEALAKHRAKPLSDHVEIETYTWDVLPGASEDRRHRRVRRARAVLGPRRAHRDGVSSRLVNHSVAACAATSSLERSLYSVMCVVCGSTVSFLSAVGRAL